MKTLLLSTTLVLGMAASSALASDTETKDAKQTKVSTETQSKEKTKPTKVVKKHEILLTGSHIKREIRRDGQITDAPNSLTVIDQKAIERSGGADLRQVIARQSSFR